MELVVRRCSISAVSNYFAYENRLIKTATHDECFDISGDCKGPLFKSCDPSRLAIRLVHPFVPEPDKPGCAPHEQVHLAPRARTLGDWALAASLHQRPVYDQDSEAPDGEAAHNGRSTPLSGISAQGSQGVGSRKCSRKQSYLRFAPAPKTYDVFKQEIRCAGDRPCGGRAKVSLGARSSCLPDGRGPVVQPIHQRREFERIVGGNSQARRAASRIRAISMKYEHMRESSASGRAREDPDLAPQGGENQVVRENPDASPLTNSNRNYRVSLFRSPARATA